MRSDKFFQLILSYFKISVNLSIIPCRERITTTRCIKNGSFPLRIRHSGTPFL